jgi:uncharacterized protein YukE
VTGRPALWQLAPHTDRLAAVAQHWRELSGAGDAAGERITQATAPLSAGWTGRSAQAYQAHRGRLLDACTTLSTVASQIADTVAAAATTLATAQDHLDDSWSRLLRAEPLVEVSPGRLLLSDHDGGAALRAATAEAHDIRTHADDRLVDLTGQLDQLRQRLGPAATLLRYDEAVPWPTPPELTRSNAFIDDGDRVIVNATGADDDVYVDVDPRNGDLLVTIDHRLTRFAAGTDLVLRTGAGNDRVTVAPRAGVRVTVLAGTGDDTVTGGGGDESVFGLAGRDTILGGGGADYLSGGRGGDYLDGQSGDDLIDGGTGDDALYGLGGRDSLWGGAGADYLDGGRGDDLVSGGTGIDDLFGGRDRDTLLGGADDDRLYGGDGTDRLVGGAGADHAFAQADDTVTGVADRVGVPITDAGSFIQISGTPDFQARVESDLDALRSSPTGATMLTTLQHDHDAGGDTLVIVATGAANGYETPGLSFFGPSHDRVEYNPTFDDLAVAPTPPLVVLYHELAHVEDEFAGTKAPGTYQEADNPGVPDLEREAVGLPIDDDGDPFTVDRLDPDHPFALTENGLRAELGLASRSRY